MRTFSLNQVDIEKGFRLWGILKKNERYFKKFNGGSYEEAMGKVFVLAMKNYDETKGELLPYIKKLARDISWDGKYLKEQVYDIYTEEGEVASVYRVLKEEMDERVTYKEQELYDKFGDLYLLDKEAFKALEQLYKIDTVKGLKGVRIKNKEFKEEFSTILRIYGGEFVFKTLHKYIGTYLKRRIEAEAKEVEKVKTIQIRVVGDEYLEKLPKGEVLQDSKGRKYEIDKYQYKVKGLDLDRSKWESILSSKGVYKVDISPIIDYMYREIYVEEGVDTEYIKWCVDRYMLISLGGERYRHNMDREKYIKLGRLEIILNFIYYRVGSIVALSEDSIYLKYTKAIKYNKVRLMLKNGRHFDLELESIIY